MLIETLLIETFLIEMLFIQMLPIQMHLVVVLNAASLPRITKEHQIFELDQSFGH